MNKLKLLVKPTQSGKTFYIINQIEQKLNDNDIHFVIVSNNLLETVQMENRMLNKLNAFVLSSKSECKSKDSAIVNFILNDKKVMICCKNPNRIKDMQNMLSSFEDKNHKNIYIWIDEADDRFKITKEFIDVSKKYNNVSEIHLVTATPEKIKEAYKKINIIKLEVSYDPSKYVSLKNDCKFSNKKYKDIKIVGYIDRILSKKNENNKTAIKAGHNFYIPAGREKRKHNQMKKRLIDEFGFNVLIINGLGWNLYGIDFDEPIKIQNNNEQSFQPSQLIAKIYAKYNLKKRPFAITGEICIGRGVTFCSKDFMFTHAIFSDDHVKKGDAAYQAIGRVTGNYKDHLKKKIRIYCPKEFQDIVLQKEKDAMNCPIC